MKPKTHSFLQAFVHFRSALATFDPQNHVVVEQFRYENFAGLWVSRLKISHESLEKCSRASAWERKWNKVPRL